MSDKRTPGRIAREGYFAYQRILRNKGASRMTWRRQGACWEYAAEEVRKQMLVEILPMIAELEEKIALLREKLK
jgi:hypothetical protein